MRSRIHTAHEVRSVHPNVAPKMVEIYLKVVAAFQVMMNVSVSAIHNHVVANNLGSMERPLSRDIVYCLAERVKLEVDR